MIECITLISNVSPVSSEKFCEIKNKNFTLSVHKIFWVGMFKIRVGGKDGKETILYDKFWQ